MDLPVMLGKQGRLDVHAAVVASRLLGVTGFAVEWSAVEELLQPRPLAVVEVDEVARQEFLAAAAVALTGVVL
jgi:hypothetical protein